MDATSDLIGSALEGRQEHPIQRLKCLPPELGLQSREAEVVSQIIELARVALSLDQRLNHISR